MRALVFCVRNAVIVVAGILIASCTASDGPTAPPPTIALSLTTLSFSGVQGGSNPAAQTFAIANTGGGTLSWSASANVNWLTLSPTSSTGAGTVTVSVNAAGLTAGSHSGTVTVGAPGASNTPQTVAVSLTLTQPPAIGLNVTQLSFSGEVGGANPAAQTFDISNAGGGTLNWTATDDVSWLTLSSASGSGAATVTANVNTTGLNAGTHNGTITVAATGASNTPRTIAVTLTLTANYNGSWTGKTSQDSTITLEISNNAVSRIYFGWRVAACGVSGTTTTNFTTPFDVASGSFTRSAGGPPLTYTISGTFSGPKNVAGNLAVTFSSGCTGTVNLTWSATRP